ncbi:MAG: transcriptional repressor [Muribaculaceae bacterium]|nr:transcriptional repressor [Muribaculaceae bacterium]MDE7080630.1 transcriptional repressor [Muribaculaceae bacterium]
MEKTMKYSDRQLAEMLTGAGVRPSLHRLAVLSTIANDRCHPSADDLYRRISEQYPGVSRTTVYNSLHALVDAGLVKELKLERGVSHFDFLLQPPHGHFICSHCGRIFDMGLPPELADSADPGFRIDAIDLNFKGICPDCLAKQQ